MPQRYELDDPQAWVEFGDSWTRGEVLRFAELEDSELFAFLGRKMIACNFPLGDNELLEDPLHLDARMDDLDLRAFNWFVKVISLEYGRIGRLGESTGRQWLESYVKAKMTTEPLTAPVSS